MSVRGPFVDPLQLRFPARRHYFMSFVPDSVSEHPALLSPVQPATVSSQAEAAGRLAKREIEKTYSAVCWEEFTSRCRPSIDVYLNLKRSAHPNLENVHVLDPACLCGPHYVF